MSNKPITVINDLRSLAVGLCFVVPGYEGSGVFMIISANVLNKDVCGTVCLRPIPTSSPRQPFIGETGETRWTIDGLAEELRDSADRPILVGAGEIEESLAYWQED